ncbi:MAG: hypothetical protein COA44_14165 [Arcobacter sp.]|nr:MAG: hypothetical protein COA44_14165 [Arcobacter sp.]
MKNLVFGLLLSLVFLGCTSKEVDPKDLEAKLVVQQSVAAFVLKDQHQKAHTIPADTTTLIFAFSKDMGHTCNDFFASKEDTYLNDNHSIFVADVSGAPSIIRSMFIMPGLKDFKHTVLVIDDKNVATGYKVGMDTEKIVIVSLDNNIITKITTVTTTQELANAIEAK